MLYDDIYDFYKKALELGKFDNDFKAKLKTISDKDELKSFIDEKVCPIAKSMGYNFTAEDLLAYEIEYARRLSEHDIENISGGVGAKDAIAGAIVSLCAIGGGMFLSGEAHAMYAGAPAPFEQTAAADATKDEDNLSSMAATAAAATAGKGDETAQNPNKETDAENLSASQDVQEPSSPEKSAPVSSVAMPTEKDIETLEKDVTDVDSELKDRICKELVMPGYEDQKKNLDAVEKERIEKELEKYREKVDDELFNKAKDLLTFFSVKNVKKLMRVFERKDVLACLDDLVGEDKEKKLEEVKNKIENAEQLVRKYFINVVKGSYGFNNFGCDIPLQTLYLTEMERLIPKRLVSDEFASHYEKAEKVSELYNSLISTKWLFDGVKEKFSEQAGVTELEQQVQDVLNNVKQAYLKIYAVLREAYLSSPKTPDIPHDFGELPNASQGMPEDSYYVSWKDRYGNIYPVGLYAGGKHPERNIIGGRYTTKGGKLLNASKVVRAVDRNGQKFSIIATQAPTFRSFDDFLDLLHTSNIDGVVVLGMTEANWYGKIPAYFSSVLADTPKLMMKDGKVLYGSYRFYNPEAGTDFVGNSKKYVIKFEDEAGNKTEKPVYNFSDWPDKGLPTDVEKFIEFAEQFKDKRKLVVHCSAGIGRTGVFVAYLYALRTGETDPYKIVYNMRQYRVGMVQTSEQFNFLCYLCNRLNTESKEAFSAGKNYKALFGGKEKI